MDKQTPTPSSPSAAYLKRLRRHVSGRERLYFAIATPRFEAHCRQELVAALPDVGHTTTEAGGVAFSGRLADCLNANLHLRTATRILMRIDTFHATNPRQLEKKTAAIAWELFLPPGAPLVVRVTSHRSRLYHSDAITAAIRAGVAARSTGAPALSAPPPQTLFVRILEDRVTLSLDSSGSPLYKRGLKSGPARAPIRETLAAGILMAAEYDPAQPLVDPMCGSGTFTLEAAMLAKKIAPGRHRSFAFMDWPAFSDNPWEFLKRDADARIETLRQPRIFTSDVDDAACRRLARTVVDNDLADAARVSRRDLFACRGADYDAGPGLVTINPPYGIRIGTAGQAERLFGDICRHLARHFRGWQVALIVPRKALLRHLPFKAAPIPLFHGGLRLILAIGRVGA